ncbi:SAM domain protein [Moumouvirus australiensis]|uniref:SAM domain protein n=1 Tax=Moumouvirus australiensis TaxID=2109587 RepID=A0A2P1EL57_9VIRU|nr:SAM domain protein [Moumouvirus australiensis]AVL94610.1 SAM domain protein [Moumouvirus australiensis]
MENGRMDQNIYEFIETLIKIGDNRSQLIFFKLRPVIIKELEIINIWIDTYTSIIEEIDDSNITMEKKEKLLVVRNNAINFLKCGLISNYLNLDTTNHYKIIKILETHENKGYINFLKLNLTKHHYIENRNKTLSQFSIGEMMKNNSGQVFTKSSIDLRKKFVSIMEIETNDFVNSINKYFVELYRKINAHDILNKIIVNEHMSENLEEIIDLFTKLFELVVVEILFKQENNHSKIIKAVNKFIDIADKFYETNNFQAFFAIVAGLNNHAIQRIKFIWKPNKSRTTTFSNYEKIITHYNGYSYYRSLIKTRPKYIPYLGLILSDIDHILQAGIIDKESFVINTINYNILSKIINNFESVIPLPGSIKKNYNVFRNEMCDYSIINFLKNIISLDEEKIYEQSYYLYKVDNIDIEMENTKSNKKCNTLNKSPRNNHDFGSQIRYEQISSLIDGSNIKNQLDLDKYHFIYNVPIKSWTTHQVQDWLEFINLAEYIKLFKTHKINGFVLDELNHNNLKNDLQIDKLGHRLRIMKFVNNIKHLFYPN